MSKLNAVRFINLNYNHNMIRVSDETMHFNGESTLIKLDNGGGKSVLVQMMTAPFVQKRYRNTKDRPFSSYFTSSRPTFILVEWELEQQAGYVLTGMMVRQNQKTEDGNEDELEIINFISEYRSACIQDIHHLPVVEKTKDELKLKSFAECRALFDSYKRDRSVRFFSYDMNNSAQARQYFDKLLEYGINYREWQNIIKKVNEEESGLSKLFADCRDERGLIEKWFLETIENKLNRDQNRMQEFRNILEKYIASYRSNQDKIQRRDIILRFEEEAVKVRKQADEYRVVSEQRAAKINEIAAYITELQSMQEAASLELVNERAYIEELKEELRKTEHQRHSADYYSVQDQIGSIEEEIKRLAELLATLEKELVDWERTFHLLETAYQQEQVDTVREDYEQAVQKLEVCRRQGEDLKPERDYIGYLLRGYFEAMLMEVRKALEETGYSLLELADRRKTAEGTLSKIEQDARAAALEIGSLRSSVLSYDQEEERFFTRWKVDLNRNLMGEYDSGFLSILAERLESELTEGIQERAAKRRRREALEAAIRKLEDLLSRQEKTRQSDSDKLVRAKETLAAYEEELQIRRTVLQYLELKEDALFDTDRILGAADGKIEELSIFFSRAAVEADDLEAEIRNLTTGQTIELTPELQHMLESLDIPVVYGMEWLKRNGHTEEANLALVEKNPFLPYSLLMSEKEFERLHSAEIPVYTSAPIPIVTRESLANGAMVTENASGGIRFYMLFNCNLLNEERLEVLIAQKRRELERKQAEITRKKKEHREYLERRTKVADQKVTKLLYDEVNDTISALTDRIEKLRREYTETKGQLADAQAEKQQLEGEIAALERTFDEKTREKKDLEELTQAYERYLSKKAELQKAEKKLKSLDAAKAELQNQIGKIADEIRLLEERQSELKVQESDASKELTAYEWYQEAAAPVGFDALLQGDYTALAARYRAITDTVAREEKELEAARQKAADRLQKAQKELYRRAQKYGFSEEDWKNVRFSVASQDHAESQIGALRAKIQENTNKKHALDIQKNRQEEALRGILERMQRDCGVQIPLSQEEVPVTNFEEQKKVLLHQKGEHERTAELLNGRISIYGSNLTSLSEYQDVPVSEFVRFKEDFGHFSETEFRAFTGRIQREYRSLVEETSEQKNRLEKVLQQTIRMKEFQDDYYRKPLETILSLSADAEQVLRQLEVILQSYRDLMAKLMVDIAVVEQEKAQVIAALKEYASDIHAQMGKIDRNSSVLVRGKPLKMLKISLPSWEENENIYQRRIEDMVEDLTQKGVRLLESGESVHEFVGKRLTTKELYDAVVGIGNVRIQLYKIEAQRELQISWSDVASNSGGEGFLSAFIILSSLLYYMRRDETDIFADKNEGKVLLMDNPFAQTNASHLLKPMMEVAKKNNTQLICLTGLGGESIYNRFDNIYVLNLVESALNSAQYLKGKHLSGNEPEFMSLTRFEVSGESGQMELLF